MSVINAYRFVSASIYFDWYLPTFRDTVFWRSNIGTLNSALSAIGKPQLTGFYYTCTETNATQFTTRWMTSNSTAYRNKADSWNIRYCRIEYLSDTSAHSIGDLAFGGMIFRIVTDSHVFVMTLDEWTGTEWANDNSTLFGYTSWDDGPGNTAGIASATSTSRAQDALDYEL